MDLKQILLNANKSNIRFLIKTLKASEDSKAKSVLFSILEGKDLFESVSSQSDEISKIILKTRNIEALNEVGYFMKYRQELKDDTLKALNYPIVGFLILIFMSFFLNKFTNNLLKFPIISFFLFPVSLAFFFLYFYKKIQNVFKKLTLTRAMILFFDKKISIFQLIDITKQVEHNNIPSFANLISKKDIVKKVLGENLDSSELLTEKKETLEKEIKVLFQTIIDFSKHVAVFSIAIIVIYSMFSSFKNFDFKSTSLFSN